MAQEPFHKTIIRALDKTCDANVVKALADLIADTHVGEGIMEIARALEHAQQRIPHTQHLPTESIDSAFDSLGEQMH
jgi:hypothetical protein